MRVLDFSLLYHTPFEPNMEGLAEGYEGLLIIGLGGTYACANGALPARLKKSVAGVGPLGPSAVF